jgi:hypothetical protein
MFYLDTQTNTRYYLGRAFSYGNKNYLPSGATAEVFEGLGFTKVVIQQRPDDAFYFVSGPDNTGAYTATPRDLAELKTKYIRQAKTTAFQLLKGTDWYIVRQMELGYSEAPVPADVTSFRAAVRAASTSRCDAIDATTTVEELKTLIDDSDVFPETPDEVTTYG